MKVEEMEAGRELDALVAEVMGLEVFTSKADYFDKGTPHAMTFAVNVHYPAYYDHVYQLATCVPHYSTNIAAAWQVVEKLQSSGWPVVRIGTGDILGSLWQCEFADSWHEVSFEGDRDVFDNAPTAPLAICRAALKAVGVEAQP